MLERRQGSTGEKGSTGERRESWARGRCQFTDGEFLRPLLSFLEHAFNPAKGQVQKFLDYDRRWNEAAGSEDCHGRALWALGTVLGRSSDRGLRCAAGRLFELSLPAVVEFYSPRACAYTLLGIQEYLDSYPGDRDAQKIRSVLAGRLLAMYESIRRPDWKWFENVLAYGNARLPQALLIAGSASSDDRMVSAGLEALDWLNETNARKPTATLCRSGRRVFIARTAKRPALINSRLRLPAQYRRACKPIESPAIAAGETKPGRPSTGFWAATTSSFLFMIPSPAAAATAFIPSAPMRTRVRNRRCRF
jgi:hypothetical protein